MSDPADAWRSIVWQFRSLPSQFGLRPYSVSILIGTWSEDHVGDGNIEEQTIPILESGGANPKLIFLDEEQRALNELGIGSCKIGPITPYFGSGGTPLSDLLPSVTNGQSVHVVITGPRFPKGAKYSIKKVETDHALHWHLTCEPVDIQV